MWESECAKLVRLLSSENSWRRAQENMDWKAPLLRRTRWLARLGWQFINKGWIHSHRALKPAACCHSRLWAAKELKSHITPRTFYQGKGGSASINTRSSIVNRARVCVADNHFWGAPPRPRKSIFQHSATIEKTHTIQDEEDQRRRNISF